MGNNKKTTKKVVNKKLTKKKTSSNIKKTQVKKNNKVSSKKVSNKQVNNKKQFKYLKIIPVIVMLLLMIPIISIGYPKVKNRLEIKKIEKEINTIIKNNNELDREKIIKENIASSDKLKELEIKVENYLINIIDIKEQYNEIVIETKIIDNNDKENIDKLTNIKEKLIKIKEENKYESDDENLNSLYNSLIKDIDSLINEEEIDNKINYLEVREPIVKYLEDNKDYYTLEEDVIIFNKRNKYEDFKEKVESLEIDIEYKLIDDKKAPTITASNITLYKGNTVNIKNKVKCVDDVDDEVECVISGTFNSSKVGEYKITISSKDKAGNENKKEIKVIVKEKETNTTQKVTTGKTPYYIEVIRNQNIVIVYGKDSNNNYTKVVKVFVASVGKNGKTPTGTFKTTKGQVWGSLIGGVYGQYSTRIVGSILFHSVPYYSKNKGDLEWKEYNKLGTAASAGCVRLAVRDSKWIYDNIAAGTTVKIYDGQIPAGISKPSAIRIPANSPNKGWDPTDPDPKNPWKK